MINNWKYFKLLIFLPFLAFLTSCDKEEPLPAHVEINNWIYDTMKEVYLWTDFIPPSVDKTKEPELFFKDLLYYQDRFSAIYPDYVELQKALEGVSTESGYEYMLAKVSSSSDEVVAIILYIKENSPAAQANLERGDVITKINGTLITTSNYKSLLKQLQSTHTITYKRFNNTTSEFEVQPDVTLDAVVISENPNFLYKVITSETGKKVGYLVYNFFDSGPNNTTVYDDELKQIFADFKAQGINELILDLRYNSGGSLTSAIHLASLAGQNVDDTKIFSENKWNDLYQNYIEGLDNGDQILRRRFVNLQENIGDQLSSGKIYVLTGSRTASASELIINGLRPYMEVFLIGEETVGKNVGSILLNEEDNPDNPYGILPIVFQVYNSAGESDYGDGFIPDILVEDLQFPLLPLGDVNEPLLSMALANIDGKTTGRIYEEMSRPSYMTVEPIMSSIDKKAYSNKLIIRLNN